MQLIKTMHALTGVYTEWKRVHLWTLWNIRTPGSGVNDIATQQELRNGYLQVWKNKLRGLSRKSRWDRNQGQARTFTGCERQLMCEVLCPAVALSTPCCVRGHLGPPRATKSKDPILLVYSNVLVKVTDDYKPVLHPLNTLNWKKRYVFLNF